MDDLVIEVFPEGEERWIKVKYHNSNRAASVLRFNNPNLKYSKEQLGFETVSIGAREEYMPQVEALLELKKEIDKKIDELLNKYTINK